MSENDFYQLQGNKYRGSRYSNFSSTTATPQGDIPNASNENSVSSAIANTGNITPTSQAPSAGLLSKSSGGSNEQSSGKEQSTASALVGGALPFVGSTVGQTAGAAIGAGANLSQGLSSGLSSLANKVSFGTIGTAGNATNAALAGLGGKAGPATQQAVNAASATKLGSGANLGGAAGAGIGTFAATLLAGGDFKEAAKAGAGSAVGTAIGTAVAGPVGGFIGGTIGSLFCFVKGTPILMNDGTLKMVEDIVLGDIILEGGAVMGIGEAYCNNIVEYKGIAMSGEHAIFENGVWMRAEESELSTIVEINGEYGIVYPLATQNHLVITPEFIAADILEIDNTEDGYTEEQRIDILNSMLDRNIKLTQIEKEVCGVGR
jgi:hypothetical protein